MPEAADFIDFLRATPSSFHAAAEVASRLEAAGFTRQDPGAAWDATPGGHVLVSGGAAVAWWVPASASQASAFRVVGAHNDSPGFVLKPNAEFTAAGWRQLAVEVYGGPIIPSWFDRDLELAGRLALRDGSTALVRTGAVARIPHLAIHLHRSNDFEPDRQRHVQPVLGPEGTGRPFKDVLADAAGVGVGDIVAADLITVDAQGPAELGGMLAAGRLDNLTSVWAGLEAITAASREVPEGRDVLVFTAFDHEEVGSASPTGAGGPLLTRVLGRTARALGADEDARAAMLERSFCVSADAAHSVHPNYPEKHDPGHQPILGRGPVTKINANQRYSSTAVTVARWRAALAAAGVRGQDFVGNNAVPCGSTIGPISATRTGVPTVDVGVPLLSMHSARELCDPADVAGLATALTAYYRL